jgi:hypothetical protein
MQASMNHTMKMNEAGGMKSEWKPYCQLSASTCFTDSEQGALADQGHKLFYALRKSLGGLRDYYSLSTSRMPKSMLIRPVLL